MFFSEQKNDLCFVSSFVSYAKHFGLLMGTLGFFSSQPVLLLAQDDLDPEKIAVRFVFSQEIELSNREWIEEAVFDLWFGDTIPKICHICDNVYRYPVDNGSVVIRGLRNMINRRKLAEILEVSEFLSIMIRRIGGEHHAEMFRYNLSAEEPFSTSVEKLSEPWF